MSETLSFVDPASAVKVLSGQPDIDLLMGLQGRFMPPLDFIEEEVAGKPGSRLRKVKIKARDMSLPVRFKGADVSALRTTMRSFFHTVDPTRGIGKIRITAPDGSQREINCVYKSGLEIEESHMTSRFQKAVPVFRAHDPFWYDLNATSLTYNTGTVQGWFPIFPLHLSSSSVLAGATITNDGDLYTWPTWVLHGPMSAPILRNLTTGQMISLPLLTLALGEYVTISTGDFLNTVTKSDNTNAFSYLSNDSDLWALQAGVNQLQIEASGATSASSIQLAYKRRYWSA
jgi:phage-related protein